MKNIFIFPVGVIHRDPAPYRLFADLIQDLHNKDIPVVFADETHESVNLAQRIKVEKSNWNIIKTVMATGKYNRFLKKSSECQQPFFCVSDLENIMKWMKKIDPTVDDITIAALSRDLLRNNAFPEIINLYELIQSLGIKYKGLEDAELGKQIQMEFLRQNNATYREREDERTNHMVKNLIASFKLFPAKGGVLIANIGANHVHRFATKLMLYIQKNSDLQKHYNIKIKPITLFSPYVTDGIATHEHVVRWVSPIDTPEVLNAYPLMPCVRVLCTETQSGFDCPELKNFRDLAISHLKMGHANKYFIPNFNDEKKKLILELNGSVIQIRPDLVAEVSLDTEILYKENRIKLGLERRLITLNGTSGVKEYLKSIKDITIEETGNDNKILVTLPKSALAQIEKLDPTTEKRKQVQNKPVINNLCAKVGFFTLSAAAALGVAYYLSEEGFTFSK